MKIPYKNTNRFWRSSKGDVAKAIFDCVENNDSVGGSKVKIFEQRLKKYLGRSTAAVNSGSSALLSGFEAFKLKKGDKVVVPAIAPMEVPMTLSKIGCHIIFTDCNLDNYTIDLRDLESKLAPDTKAIICVDLFGHTCDYDAIKTLVKALWRGKFKVPIIQVAFQSFGGKYKNKINGSYSDLTIFDFSPGNNLYCFGNGGAVAGSPDYTTVVSLSSNKGKSNDADLHDIIGWDCRMEDIQANLLNLMIKKVDNDNVERQKIAQRYNKELKNGRRVETARWCTNVYSEYTVLIKHSKSVVTKLNEVGIDAKISFSKPCHLQPIYNLKWKLPNSVLVSDQMIGLPIWPRMTDAEVSFVIEQFNKIT